MLYRAPGSVTRRCRAFIWPGAVASQIPRVPLSRGRAVQPPVLVPLLIKDQACWKAYLSPLPRLHLQQDTRGLRASLHGPVPLPTWRSEFQWDKDSFPPTAFRWTLATGTPTTRLVPSVVQCCASAVQCY